MNTSLFSKTPTVTVIDNRGLTVRNIAYHRHPSTPEVTSERITRHQYDARGFLTQSADPRLHEIGQANFNYLTDLTGKALRSQGVDNGTTVSLNDVAGRLFIAISNIHTADDGTEDLSQAVTRLWQYEDAELLGRPVSVTEQMTGGVARISERFVYAGNTDAEKSLNLAGQCVSHYDTVGLVQTNSVSLTGVPLSVSRRLLKDADKPDTVADWQGEGTSAWNDLLESEAHTTLTTTDATGTMLTTTDAKGNLQRVMYDIAGLLSRSWLTLKGDTEQFIVRSLTYSAAGQKLREEHGNGVVTTYTYEAQTQRLIGIKTQRPAGHAFGAKVLQDLRYKYDPMGNVMKISNDAEATRFWYNQKVIPENTYVYDSLYQLVSATGREMVNANQQCGHLTSVIIPLPADNCTYTNYTRTYSYDSAGNLTQIRHSAPATNHSYTTNITVSNKSNRGVLSTLTENPSDVDALFTAGGQQKQLQPGLNLVWTPRNELLQVTPVVRDASTDDRESYRYDGSSQRLLKISIQKTNSSQQTQRALYLPELELRTTSTGNIETESLQVITVGEAGRAQVRALHWERGKPAGIRNGQMRYSYDNLIGSGTLELDGDGSVISMEEYYPYGGTAVWTARSAVEADYKTVRYSGKERDATGLYYYGYRYYQPWSGRWLSADPAGTVDGLNLFLMCRNNSATYRDDNGLVIDIDRVKAVANNIVGRYEQNETPLPRNLLHIWIGPKRLPDEFTRNVNAFNAMNLEEGFQSFLFTDSSLEPARWKKMLSNLNPFNESLNNKIRKIDVHTSPDLSDFRTGPLHAIYQDAIRNKRYAQGADILRIQVLNQFGGIYADVDDVPLVPAKINTPTLGILTTHHQKQPDGQFAVCNSPIMSVPEHPVLKKMINDLPNSYYNSKGDIDSILHSTGPYLFTHALESIFPFMKESLAVQGHREHLNISDVDVNDEYLKGALEIARSEVQRAGLYVRLGHAGSWKN